MRRPVTFLAEHQRAVGPVLRRHDGRIVKRLGDAMPRALRETDNAIVARALVDKPVSACRTRPS